MKYLLKFTPMLFLTLTILSCGKDEEQGESQTENQFEYQEEKFTTENAAIQFYQNLYLDENGVEQSEYDEAFTLILTDGNFITEDGSVDFSLDTKQAIFLEVEINEDSTVDDLGEINISNIEYSLTDNTEIFTSIAIETDPDNTSATSGSIDYESTFVIPFADSDKGTLVLNEFSIDFTTKTGSIDCTYSITSEAVGLINGQYKGDFVVVVD